ncbi:MAG: oligosaccharide flippase family protein [Clostridiales bacterium]|nr:oligosaccharide flippase family protein [Clostridiales bacterium]MDO4349914.1 oligosaccharide flippase family protein [Eubacteriales bacterium]MDY4008360.1 oligosaccharide flippase family protein [Candidatus Limiplasma sp.]
MKATGAKKQTLFLTGINATVRALGLLLRVILSRFLGAEIMGISELAQSVHMLVITPLTSGMPMAISRMTARAKEADKQKPLLAGIWLVRVASAILIPALLLLSPLLARWMGDVRVLPSMWFSAPCILILGYSAAFNGYCYGMEWSKIPALSELIEQVSRLGFTLMLLTVLERLTAPWLAAMPVAATMVAELIGLAFVLNVVRIPLYDTSGAARWRSPIFRLAAPATVTRLVQTLLRSLTAILIPLKLQQSGLSAAESTARLGMFNGMVMPIIMLPCVFTSALSMVAMPRIAKAEEAPRELKRLLMLCFASCIPIGLMCAGAVYASAPLLANRVYRLAELTELFRFSAPLTLLLALAHLTGGITASLGQQKRSMYGALAVSLLTLALTCWLTPLPGLRLHGVIIAQAAGEALHVMWNTGVLFLWRHERRSLQAR